MWTILALIIVCGGAYVFGWSHGSQAGFSKAVEQLDKIIASVNKMNQQ